MNNALFAIALYRVAPGVWGFDDARVGLVAEPFVGATNTMIDKLFAHFRATNNTLTFSDKPIPRAERWTWRESDGHDGNWYEYDGVTGWLCSALLLYFPKPPAYIYLIAS